jgi:outer membrane protein assembly factor BamB
MFLCFIEVYLFLGMVLLGYRPLFALFILLGLLSSLFLAIAYAVDYAIPPSPEFLPDNSYTWTLFKGDSGSTMHSSSDIPRIPRVLYSVNVSSNLGGRLATPLVGDGLVVIADSRRVCGYSDVDGSLIWTADILDTYGASITALGMDDKVYIATSGRIDVHGEDIPALLIALDKWSGASVWVRELTGMKSSVTSNLVIYEGRIVFGTIWADSSVYCYDRDGNLIWVKGLTGLGNIRGIAVGNGMVFVTGENDYWVYALDIDTGDIIWSYEHGAIPGTPLYWEGRLYFIDSRGYLLCLDSNGAVLWSRDVGGGSDVNTNSFLTIDDDGHIYIVKTLGEDNGILKLDNNGNEIGFFKISRGEVTDIPVMTKRLLLLPVSGPDYVKIYFLWNGLNEIHSIVYKPEETFRPSISVANASIYIIIPYDRSRQMLMKLVDDEPPIIKDISDVKEVLADEAVDINATIYDGRSGIYKAILFYQVNNSEPKYIAMDIVRRYIIEPIGGYGFSEEQYIATIPGQPPGSNVTYWILAVDNVGNYLYSDVYSYIVVKPKMPLPPQQPSEQPSPVEEPQPPSIWMIIIPVLAVLAVAISIYFIRIKR